MIAKISLMRKIAVSLFFILENKIMTVNCGILPEYKSCVENEL